MATLTNQNGTSGADSLFDTGDGDDTIEIQAGNNLIVHVGAGDNNLRITGG